MFLVAVGNIIHSNLLWFFLSTNSIIDWNDVQSFFFYKGFLHGHWRFTGQQGKEGDHLLFHSTTSTRSRTLSHLITTLQMRLLYHPFLIVTLVTRLLLDEIYHIIELPFNWLIDDAMFVCLLDELILGFCYSDLTLETDGFELASTIALVLQGNQLTQSAITQHSYQLLKSAYYTNFFRLYNTISHDCLSVVNILYFNHFQWLAGSSINRFVTLAFAAVLEIFLQTFDSFFPPWFILMSSFISYIFLQLMLLVLMKECCLNAQECYRSLFFKDAS